MGAIIAELWAFIETISARCHQIYKKNEMTEKQNVDLRDILYHWKPQKLTQNETIIIKLLKIKSGQR